MVSVENEHGLCYHRGSNHHTVNVMVFDVNVMNTWYNMIHKVLKNRF